MSVKLRNRDDFPADCDPTITSYPQNKSAMSWKVTKQPTSGSPRCTAASHFRSSSTPSKSILLASLLKGSSSSKVACTLGGDWATGLPALSTGCSVGASSLGSMLPGLVLCGCEMKKLFLNWLLNAGRSLVLTLSTSVAIIQTFGRGNLLDSY